jgi:hypothetical protein
MRLAEPVDREFAFLLAFLLLTVQGEQWRMPHDGPERRGAKPAN